MEGSETPEFVRSGYALALRGWIPAVLRILFGVRIGLVSGVAVQAARSWHKDLGSVFPSG